MLVGNSGGKKKKTLGEEKKKPLAARKLRINTPFSRKITVGTTAIPSLAAARFANTSFREQPEERRRILCAGSQEEKNEEWL
jgi:hypothetical protein